MVKFKKTCNNIIIMVLCIYKSYKEVYNMKEDTMFQTTAIIDIDEQLRKEEEIMNTIKMEPILGTTEIEEEEELTIKQKRVRVTDYFLISLIVILSVVFILVIFKIM